MAKMNRALTFLFLLYLLIVFFVGGLALETYGDDPEVERCKEQCMQEADKRQQEVCQDRCAQEKLRGGGDDSGTEEQYYRQEKLHGGGDDQMSQQERLRGCQQQCEGREEQYRPECSQQCMEQQQQQPQPQPQPQPPQQQQQQQQEKGKEDKNPYIFEKDHHFTWFELPHGLIRVTTKFTYRSQVLDCVQNYRLAVLETDPLTFIKPLHWDADLVFVVVQGIGTINTLSPDRRQTFNFRRGDIFMLSSGTTSYLINRSTSENLLLVLLLKPVSDPDGDIESFYGSGGDRPTSFFNVFSPEVLEAAFNMRRDRLERWLERGEQVAIMKASEQQIRAMSPQEWRWWWPFGTASQGTFNLFEKRPLQANPFGDVREAVFGDYAQLQDLNVVVSLVTLQQGAMRSPFYNTKSNMICTVINGKGYFEMPTPHLANYSGGGSRPHPTGRLSYEGVKARLENTMAFIVPAGHPVIMGALPNQTLQVLCFHVNARDNQRIPLTGGRGIYRQMEREAKELGFGMQVREVDEILTSQIQDWFVRGPPQLPRQHQARADL